VTVSVLWADMAGAGRPFWKEAVVERVGAGEVEVRAGDADDLEAGHAELRGVAGITVEMVLAQAGPAALKDLLDG